MDYNDVPTVADTGGDPNDKSPDPVYAALKALQAAETWFGAAPTENNAAYAVSVAQVYATLAVADAINNDPRRS